MFRKSIWIAWVLGLGMTVSACLIVPPTDRSCINNIDCYQNEFCSAGICTSGCFQNADCPTSTWCAEGACVPPEQIRCEFDQDCPPDSVCDYEFGRCTYAAGFGTSRKATTYQRIKAKKPTAKAVSSKPGKDKNHGTQ
ncbi:MAG: hypothetical protein EP343_26925 [Deltaproteobacteria bacterium]|nr:MAG: hypothetical protein EP343_26925 [Deltaproteobacteria bacterium]